MWATFAWSMKPLAGVLTDAFPIRGSRRRAYLVLGRLVGGSCWALLSVVTGNSHLFLLVSILLNIGLVLASTAMGGLQVEAGQLFGLSGRISSLRQVVVSIALVAGPLLGGWLAKKAFGFTAGVGTLVMLALVMFALFRFKETAPTLPPAEPASARGPALSPVGHHLDRRRDPPGGRHGERARPRDAQRRPLAVCACWPSSCSCSRWR